MIFRLEASIIGGNQSSINWRNATRRSCNLPLAPGWGTLAFGGLWTLALVVIGVRLRKLGRERGPD